MLLKAGEMCHEFQFVQLKFLLILEPLKLSIIYLFYLFVYAVKIFIVFMNLH